MNVPSRTAWGKFLVILTDIDNLYPCLTSFCDAILPEG